MHNVCSSHIGGKLGTWGGVRSGAGIESPRLVESLGRVKSRSYSHSYTQGSLDGAMFRYGPFQTMLCIIIVIGLTCVERCEMIF